MHELLRNRMEFQTVKTNTIGRMPETKRKNK